MIIGVVWPAFTKTVLLSNDGGFGGASTFAVAAQIPWTLASSGPERLPKTVYLRFDDSTQTFTDDIILDQKPPAAAGSLSEPSRLAAMVAGKKRMVLRLRASDGNSGVNKVQIRRGHAPPFYSKQVRKAGKPGLRRLRKRIVFRAKPGTFWVRAFDAAGNASRWKKVKSS